MEATIDVLLLQKLPQELKRMIVTFAFLLQMQDAFSTNDHEEMAKRVCNYGQPWSHSLSWLIALVSPLE